MKRYKHKFKKGDIVTDTEHNEVFVFDNRSDGYVASTHPNWFRLANESERKELKESGKEAITLKNK